MGIWRLHNAFIRAPAESGSLTAVPRTFDWSAESPVSVEQIRSAFSDQDYWLARLANYGAGTDTLNSLIVDADGTVTVATTFSVFGDRLPKVVTQLYRGDVKMVRDEKWTPAQGGRMRGEISTTAPGTPLSVLTEALLEPVQDGSRLNYITTVEVRLPMVGGKIERHIGNKVPEQIAATHRFTMAWITENA